MGTEASDPGFSKCRQPQPSHEHCRGFSTQSVGVEDCPALQRTKLQASLQSSPVLSRQEGDRQGVSKVGRSPSHIII